VLGPTSDYVSCRTRREHLWGGPAVVVVAARHRGVKQNSFKIHLFCFVLKNIFQKSGHLR
jgi:hypothetical protein